MTTKYPAGQFKAECLKLMDRVKKYGQSVTITKHGKPVAKLVPVNDEQGAAAGPFGVMAGTGEVQGDIVKPLKEKWNADDK
ncbi:prevent-host-death protein [Bdellovibrio bacteriovorus]|uniref:Antitoxin n=1 Tax=Bdellovibrio bacteriovorus TaxID=959 RepID=A0A150WL36_BDEBC|nr:type II toxin-antitoxin system prevent-host-death family antitoxin [Bdellovibrio bacteriovorus]KYG64711.1 prevent-host-death protein [Bdellovibrio bacteriovorus]